MQLVDELKAQPEQRVWVATLESGDGVGWIGMHRTPEGARKLLEMHAAEWGIDLAAIDAGDNTDGSTYMLAHLPVQE
jgi:hypothetical protein